MSFHHGPKPAGQPRTVRTIAQANNALTAAKVPPVPVATDTATSDMRKAQPVSRGEADKVALTNIKAHKPPGAKR